MDGRYADKVVDSLKNNKKMVDNLNGKAVNLKQWANEVKASRAIFEVVIKENGKIIYHNKGYSGVVNIVQSKVTIKDGDMEGDSQVLAFGNPLTIIFAFDQLKQKLTKMFG